MNIKSKSHFRQCSDLKYHSDRRCTDIFCSTVAGLRKLHLSDRLFKDGRCARQKELFSLCRCCEMSDWLENVLCLRNRILPVSPSETKSLPLYDERYRGYGAGDKALHFHLMNKMGFDVQVLWVIDCPRPAVASSEIFLFL